MKKTAFEKWHAKESPLCTACGCRRVWNEALKWVLKQQWISGSIDTDKVQEEFDANESKSD